MLNQTKSKNRSFSTFLVQRRKSFLIKRTSKNGLNFLEINKGELTLSKMDIGSCRVAFESKITGRTAFAYGPTFGSAYHNMIRLFNLKYSI